MSSKDTVKVPVGDFLKQHVEKNSEITFISSIFTIFAFAKLKETLEKVEKVKFLFNEPTFVKNIQADKRDVREFEVSMKKRQTYVSEFPLEISLKNNLDQNSIAQSCFNFIEEKAEVKSVSSFGYVRGSQIYVKNNKKDFIINGGSLSFSQDGLGYSNRPTYEFNTIISSPDEISKFENYLETVWQDKSIIDVKKELLDYIGNLYKENTPELVYNFTLYKLFNERLINQDESAKIKEKTGITKTKIWNMLYNFQHDAVIGAIKKLELYNGCIIADSVGLGKTYEALAIIKYYEKRNDRVLVIAPKKLRGNWIGFRQNKETNVLIDDRFNYDVLNHTDLSRNFGMSGDLDLATLNWGNYDLVVIDESHNFRNNPVALERKTRYQKLMEDIIKSGVKTKVLMLSATPVNNGLNDLKNQIMFITEGKDDALKDQGINSISSTLRVAQNKFNIWGKNSKDKANIEELLKTLDYSFFKLLDTMTIARSRKHIKKYYDTKDIGEFPERLKPLSIKTDIDTSNKFPDLEKVNIIILKLNLPIYKPLNYVLPTKKDAYRLKYKQLVNKGQSSFDQFDREINIVNLMRIGLLKRLESSVYSFALTVERIKEKIEDMLNRIDGKGIYESEDVQDFDDEDMETFDLGTKIKVDFKDLDKIKLRIDLEEDLKNLQYLLSISEAVNPKIDSKLKELKNLIKHKINNNLNPNNKKIIVFTAFADTAKYLYDNIAEWAYDNYHVFSAVVTGSNGTDTNVPSSRKVFEDILVRFSPKSNSSKFEDEIDLLIATDCISEGQNLQDCDYLINYDIHWNPVRIIQRFGRIDRIGSKNKKIQLVNFWPNIKLESYINLESRVKNRMTMVDLSATGEDDLLSNESKDLNYRAEQLKQLQDKVVDIEDLQGEISITDLNLDEFIMSLERYIKDHPGLLETFPTGIHAIAKKDEKLKEEAVEGAIFCLRKINYIESEKNNTTLYPHYLVYVDKSGIVKTSNANPKKILDIYKAICDGKDVVEKELVKIFNKETKNGNDMSLYTKLLEVAVNDIKGTAEEKGVKSLFNVGKSNIKEQAVTGSKDFELVTFLVIK
jgi:ERCC4-related helicase